MSDQTIKCPICGTQIELTEALTGQIEQDIRLKYEQQSTELLKVERKKIAESERKKILAEQFEEKQALQEELEEKNKKISEANRKELEFLKKQRELEEKGEQLELEVERKLSEERKKISDEASKKAVEEQQLKMREKDDQIAALTKNIGELKRKAEVGSQEAQGEALEQELQEYLERTFLYDKFQEVKKGARGADILQIVHNQTGKECGKILWESKNTKEFQKSWIEKLKKDQQEASADIAVIMSIALPKEIDGFGQYDGIWLTDYRLAVGLATALRQGLIEVAKQKLVATGQDSIKDVLYRYITGQEFTMRIRAVVEAFQRMNEELGKEKRAMTRIWNSREKQITTVIENVTGIHGSIEGLVGGQKALPEVKALSLESITEEEEEF